MGVARARDQAMVRSRAAAATRKVISAPDAWFEHLRSQGCNKRQAAGLSEKSTSKREWVTQHVKGLLVPESPGKAAQAS